MKDDRKKPDIGFGFLIALLLAVTMFNICIFSYIGCEMVPWLMAGGFDAVAEQPVTQPTPVQQTPTPATPAPTPPTTDEGQPTEQLNAPTEQIQDEPPAEPPVEETAAPKPSQAPAAEPSKSPSAQAPASSKAPTVAATPNEPILPIAPTSQPATQGSSTGTAQQGSSGGSSSSYQEEYGTIYVTDTGKRYHYDSTCNGGTYYPSTYEEAINRGLTPCQKCVLH